MPINDEPTSLAEANDEFRRSLGNSKLPGRVVVSSGVERLSSELKYKVFKGVTRFCEWETDNNHDIGSFDIDQLTFHWKIDYFRCAECRHLDEWFRVLTIALEEEI